MTRSLSSRVSVVTANGPGPQCTGRAAKWTASQVAGELVAARWMPVSAKKNSMFPGEGSVPAQSPFLERKMGPSYKEPCDATAGTNSRCSLSLSFPWLLCQDHRAFKTLSG